MDLELVRRIVGPGVRVTNRHVHNMNMKRAIIAAKLFPIDSPRSLVFADEPRDQCGDVGDVVDEIIVVAWPD